MDFGRASGDIATRPSSCAPGAPVTGSVAGFGAVLDDVNPGALLLGLIVVADYAVTVAAEAVSCSPAEMITRIAIEAGLEGR